MKKKNKFLELCDELLNNKKKFDDPKFYGLKKILIHEYTDENDKLIVPIGIGKDKTGKEEYIYMDLTEVSGIFISGTTGTGKSLFLDSVIVSLMLKNTPDEVNFLMIDPKKVELGEYDGINYININNHYKKYSISNKEKGIKALEYVLKIIEKRSDTIVKGNANNIRNYNLNHEEKLPHIFIFIDEAMDILEMKDAEKMLGKILNVGRVLGIHLILATNTYLLKMFSKRFISRFKYRLSFDLTDNIQSLYVEIDKTSTLKSSGDAIIRTIGDEPFKFQAPFIQDDEIRRVVDKLGNIN